MAGLLDTGGHELNLQGDIGGWTQGVYPDLFKPSSHEQESIARTIEGIGDLRASPFPLFRGLPAQLHLDFVGYIQRMTSGKCHVAFRAFHA